MCVYVNGLRFPEVFAGLETSCGLCLDFQFGLVYVAQFPGPLLPDSLIG